MVVVTVVMVCSSYQLVIVTQKIGPKMLDQEGKEVPGNKGYKYVIILCSMFCNI